MARTTKEEAQKTRQKLIDTAINVFYENGVSVTSLEQIAEAAELTRGAIYWHFKNKRDLVSAIHEHFHISILENFNRELSNKALPPLERIKSSWRQFLHGLAENDMHLKAISIFMYKCDYSGELAELLDLQAVKKNIARQLIAEGFQAAIDAGEITSPHTASMLAQGHMCYSHGIIHEYVTNRKVPQLKDDAERLISFFFSKL